MRSVSYLQFEIVKAETDTELKQRLNPILKELKDKRPQVTFEGLTAHISYTETDVLAEELGDEYINKGVNLHCQDCPFFEPRYKSDGTEDMRAKRGGCQFAEYRTTLRDKPACDKLFEMINDGEVRLCLGK